MAEARSVDIVDSKGVKTGTAELPAEIFDVDPNIPLMHQVVVAQRRLHQRLPRQLALRDEFVALVDQHPGAVELQAGLDQQAAAQRDAGAGLHRMQSQRMHAAVQVAQDALRVLGP